MEIDCIIHGTWIKLDTQGWFVVWGEERSAEMRKPKGRLPKVPAHPYAVSSDAIQNCLREIAESLTLDFDPNMPVGEAVFSLPSAGKIPVPSYSMLTGDEEIGLSDHKINTTYLSAFDAVQLLSSIPLHAYDLPYEIGEDIRFWSAAAKFALYIISQHKFLPMLRKDDEGFMAIWEPSLDDPSDIEKINQLVRSMPDVCRSAGHVVINTSSGSKKIRTEYNLTRPSSRDLILDFLNNGIDRWMREKSKDIKIKGIRDQAMMRWLIGLSTDDGRIQYPVLEDDLKKLCKSLSEWRDSGKSIETKGVGFRTCFRLEPPESDDSSEWNLRYFLQALDDPSLLVPGDVIWKERRSTLKYLNREFESPQEQMLTGLGIASRMFSPIDRSLRQARPEACQISLDEAYRFLNEASLLLQQSGFGVLAPPWWTERRSQISAKVKMSAKGATGPGVLSLDSILHYDWQLALGDDVITQDELEKLAKLKIPLVRMRGQWVLLRQEDIKAAMEFLDKYGESREIKLREAMQLSLSDDPKLEGIRVEAVESPEWMNSFISELKDGKMKQIRQPKDFVGTLRPYQITGLSWLAFMRKWNLGACLADDMGLGKTCQVIAFLLDEKKKKKNVPNLIVCPTSVVGNWRREVEKFAPNLTTMLHHGADRLVGSEFTESAFKHDIVITSYGLARRDAELLGSIDWKGIILDEAQNIKNPSSKIAQVVRSLKSEYRFALTGTPVENRIMELWSMMEFLNPRYLGSQRSFNQRYVLPIERYGDEIATKELRTIAAPLILRRLKTDPKIISDLPEKMEMKVFCNLTKEQVTLYEAAVQDMMQQLQDPQGDMKRKGLILAGLTKLKQLCDHPSVFLHDKSELENRSGKLQRLVEMLEEAISEGDKALVFTQFTEMGESLQKYLSNRLRCDVLYLHGGVPQKNRDKMVAMFQNERAPIFIISIKAGGTGLNLTRASYVFHFDRWWNPAVEDQATDRAFRIGQTKNVQVHKFICSGTLEEQIDQIIEKKKSLAQNIIGSGENWITELSNEELQNIVTLRRDDALSDDER